MEIIDPLTNQNKLIPYKEEASNYMFPRRNAYERPGKKVPIITNFFKFEFMNSNVKTYFKYSIDFEPELPGDALRQRRKIYASVAEQIQKKIGKHFLFTF